jgi:hypothetical protein
MHNIDERIERLYREMRPLQNLYGLKTKTIEQRYQEILAKEKIKQQRPKPKIKLPKL